MVFSSRSQSKGMSQLHLPTSSHTGVEVQSIIIETVVPTTRMLAKMPIRACMMVQITSDEH